MDPDDKETAEKYFSKRCGILHLEWALDAYWGLVTKDVILPASRSIYDALVKGDHTQSKPKMWGDADGNIFYIPNEDRKVFVHTTQTSDYLYIIHDDGEYGRFDVRRIYRDLNKDHWVYGNAMKGRKNIKSMLANAEDLTEFHDDHEKWKSNRPSLEAYRKINFEIPYSKHHMVELQHYGDARDSGYILSYDFFYAKHAVIKVEGSIYSFSQLSLITSINLGTMARDLGIEVPHLNGE